MTKRVLLAGTTLAAALAGASPLAAQTAPAATTDSSASSGQIGDIIVTAQKRSESIQKVPLAVTALSETQLASPTISDIRDIVGRTPSLVVDAVSAGPSAAAISIRGISFEDIEKSFDPAVGVVVDGVFIGTNTGQLLDSFDMSNLEVLRGPQGTLFGRNTIGGVINVTRTKPTGEFGGKASISYGNYDTRNAKLILNLPKLGDAVALKAFGYYSDTDGFYKNVTLGKTQGKDEQWSLGMTALITPTDNIEALLTYEHMRQTGETVSTSLSATGKDVVCLVAPAQECNRYSLSDNGGYTIFQNAASPLKNDEDAITANVNIELGRFTLTSVTGWRKNDEDVSQDFDGTSVDFFATNRVQQFEQFSEELRLAGDITPWLNGLVGLYYYDSNYKLKQLTNFGPGVAAPTAVTLQQDVDHDASSYAAFVDFQVKPTDRLTFGLGARYTRDEKSIFNDYGRVAALVQLTQPGWDGQCVQVVGSLAPGVDAYGPAANCNGEQSFNKFTYRATATYEVLDDKRVYASVSRGFRSGGFNGRAASPASLGPYEPEVVDAYEVGLKADWLDKRLRTNLAFYETKYDNKQEEVVQPSPPGSTNPQETVVKNAASATIRGFEAEIIARPDIEGLTLNASASYIDASYDKFLKDVNGDNIPDDVSTLMLRRAPEWTWSLGADYTRPLASGEMTLSAMFRHVDEYTTCIVPATPVVLGAVTNDPRCLASPRDILDASATYSTDFSGHDVDFTLFGRNLLDDRGIASTLPVAGLMTFGSSRPPMTYGVQVQMKF